jgi:hypothetical protein
MKKEIDMSECVITYDYDSEITMKDALIDLFVEYVNEKVGKSVIERIIKDKTTKN